MFDNNDMVIGGVMVFFALLMSLFGLIPLALILGIIGGVLMIKGLFKYF